MGAHGGIDIQVCDNDALRYTVDTLVLKYAQVPQGVDAKAIQLTALDSARLPRPGDYWLIRDPPRLKTNALVFIGVVPQREFGYPEIRAFGKRAVSAVAREVPDAREIALTLHGAGYGLDEIECFDSELAGILDAIGEGDIPRALERVSILERVPGRARRLTERLATLERPTLKAQEQWQRTVGYESAQRDHVFVAMPFSEDFGDVFRYGISAPVRETGLLCERIDEQTFTGDIVSRLKNQIRTAKLVVADLTEANPNVYLEVGFAWASDVPTVLLCHKDSDLKFDVAGQKCLLYSRIADLEEKLTKELKGLLEQ